MPRGRYHLTHHNLTRVKILCSTDSEIRIQHVITEHVDAGSRIEIWKAPSNIMKLTPEPRTGKAQNGESVAVSTDEKKQAKMDHRTPHFKSYIRPRTLSIRQSPRERNRDKTIAEEIGASCSLLKKPNRGTREMPLVKIIGCVRRVDNEVRMAWKTPKCVTLKAQEESKTAQNLFPRKAINSVVYTEYQAMKITYSAETIECNLVGLHKQLESSKRMRVELWNEGKTDYVTMLRLGQEIMIPVVI